ncbi:MAG: hypothetical protein K6G75_02730 [Lachnospiraceae bacterium]|nr:hypothetical protein [Lachnospiraceae bacterium]
MNWWNIPAYRIKKFKKSSLITPIIVLFLITVLIGAVSVGCASLRSRQKSYDAEIEKYENLIAEEEARSQEISEYAMYTKTTAYYEEVAREKYRLVHDNEILFVTDK